MPKFAFALLHDEIGRYVSAPRRVSGCKYAGPYTKTDVVIKGNTYDQMAG